MSENHWGEEVQPELKEQLNKAAQQSSGKEWKLIEKMLNGLFVEQRRARRWGIFFKAITFIYLFSLLAMFISGQNLTSELSTATGPHTAVVEVSGPIMADEEANADSIIWALRKAFKDENSKAVVVRINSPGGSPVQSGYVYDEIKRLRTIYPDKPLYAVIVDIGASGAYYIAAAADEIYADKASLVGSIGVISGGFGFVNLMEKIGVERRVMTAGDHKDFMDPFTPQEQVDKAFWQTVLDTTHQQFIEQVKQGRGDRLSNDPNLFSGWVWTGEQALKNGLIDGLGSTSFVAREVVGEEHLVDYTAKMSPFEEMIDRFGVSFGKTIATQLGLTSSYQLR